jgi:hypothetical protein
MRDSFTCNFILFSFLFLAVEFLPVVLCSGGGWSCVGECSVALKFFTLTRYFMLSCKNWFRWSNLYLPLNNYMTNPRQCSLEYRWQAKSVSQCYTPWSDPFRIYMCVDFAAIVRHSDTGLPWPCMKWSFHIFRVRLRKLFNNKYRGHIMRSFADEMYRQTYGISVYWGNYIHWMQRSNRKHNVFLSGFC